MQFDKEHIKDYLIARFLDTTSLEWHMWCDVYEDSLTALGYDFLYALRLISQRSCELHLRDHDGYTSIQVSSLMVGGEWQLHQLYQDGFAIQIVSPQFEIAQSGGNLNRYIQEIRERKGWFLDVKGAGFRDCSKKQL
ncbi:MAG: hypothetical protein GFH27_549291n163 [Chloroflexi bacterium AL-W]|nr:hypothetical protein [Chloroflexi bacterium AL-N1]NOK67370.1 hypothetical protein [Chloroflexi bacterium AL-N10]NOK75138.1 hypothetical protein [Chloroflexi bacterium AL-N5]NOK81925.1 hypothetical protein [Chloroflexi bacterium AL-W]NOK89771.1 hypothetical protein [Chloroflexi bacterium AL-N15]